MGSKGLLFKMVRCIIFIFLGAGVNFANCQDTVNFYNPEFWKFDSATINSLKLVFPKANIQDVIIQDSKAPDFVMDVYCLPLGSTGSPSNAYTRIGTYSTFVCEYTYDSNYFNICDGTEEDCLNKALEKCSLDQSCFGFAVPYNNFSQKGVYKCIHNSLSKATSSLMALYMKGIFKTQCGGGTERSCDAPCPNMANSNCMAGYVGEDNTDVLMDTVIKLNTMIQSSGSNYCQKKDFYPYCESGWTFSPITKKCYKVITSPKFWDDARSDCRSVSGGELASVTSSQINDFLRTLTKSLSWVGGYRSGSNWFWTDGSSFSYTNWNVNEPNNAGGQEDKIVFNWFGNQWNDSPGEFKYPYICQRSGADLSTRKEELIEELKNVTSRMRNDYASQNTPFADLGVCPGKIVKLWRQRKGIADCKPCCCHKAFIKQTVCKNYKGIP